jgi:hypothetical protein
MKITLSAVEVLAFASGVKTQIRRPVSPAMLKFAKGQKVYGQEPLSFHTYNEDDDDFIRQEGRGNTSEEWGEWRYAHDHMPLIRRTNHWGRSHRSPMTPAQKAWEKQQWGSRALRHYSSWLPASQLPTWGSRVILDVVDVRVEELHSATRDDKIAEGLCSLHSFDTSYLREFVGDDGKIQWDHGDITPEKMFRLDWEHRYPGGHSMASWRNCWNANPKVVRLEVRATCENVRLRYPIKAQQAAE